MAVLKYAALAERGGGGEKVKPVVCFLLHGFRYRLHGTPRLSASISTLSQERPIHCPLEFPLLYLTPPPMLEIIAVGFFAEIRCAEKFRTGCGLPNAVLRIVGGCIRHV